MKNSFVAIVILFCFAACNNNPGKTAISKNESYHFDVPAGWTSEHIPFPISFAGSIPYKGVEDVRFTGGWGNPSSDEYWSYEFVWWLDGEQAMNADTLQQNMRIYYTGLVGDNITRRNIPAAKVVPVVTAYKKIKPYSHAVWQELNKVALSFTCAE